MCSAITGCALPQTLGPNAHCDNQTLAVAAPGLAKWAAAGSAPDTIASRRFLKGPENRPGMKRATASKGFKTSLPNRGAKEPANCQVRLTQLHAPAAFQPEPWSAGKTLQPFYPAQLHTHQGRQQAYVGAVVAPDGKQLSTNNHCRRSMPASCCHTAASCAPWHCIPASSARQRCCGGSGAAHCGSVGGTGVAGGVGRVGSGVVGGGVGGVIAAGVLCNAGVAESERKQGF
eukprot:1137545-Pelagomonas_calceolata.AAC.2